MERSPDLLASIVHYCVKATAEWDLNISALELFQNLSVEKAEEWPLYLVNGHIRLLADVGYVEMSDDDLVKVVRITWAGYDYLDSVSKRPVLSDNPFMSHG
ncbi:hypothetical protein [Pseudomonas putida]|uniref:Uncharacterized protein n=1 Tax=Pseudomonas putida TaxID=303 RepID=A0A2C5W524_PSEPU|nr:hypothetical protein [Pseudomonas putida]PHH38704.1 hypothetical protein CRX57_00450 [Pseudomonas putida]